MNDPALPPEAEAVAARIEALLDQAGAVPALGGSDEAAYALRETRSRYLPDTVRAFTGLPPVHRDAGAAARLLEQLQLLERATAERLARLTEGARNEQAANGAFLAERFGALDALPAAPPVASAERLPAVLVRRALARIAALPGDGGARIGAIGTRLAEAFPDLVRVRRGGLLGAGPVRSFELTIPRRRDALRYALAAGAGGTIEASVTQVVRGVALRTERADLDTWVAALAEDLGAFADEQRTERATLERIFGA